MPDFLNMERVRLRPGASGYPLALRFAACSDAVTNDGSLPYGTTIASAAVAGYTTAGIAAALVDSASIAVDTAGLTVTCELAAGSLAEGRYQLLATVTLNSGAVIPFLARRVVVTDVAE